MTTPSSTGGNSPHPSLLTFSPLPSTLAAFRKSFDETRLYVERLRVKDVRALFSIMRRHEDCGVDHFVPKYGLGVGEFATAYVINQPHRGGGGGGSSAASGGD